MPCGHLSTGNKSAQSQTLKAPFEEQETTDYLRSFSAGAPTVPRKTKTFIANMLKRMDKSTPRERNTAVRFVLGWAMRAMTKSRSLKDGTAAGLDDVPPELLKYAPYQLFLCLAIFAADAANAEFFPPELEDGWLALIYKKHGLPKHIINSFRGLRITSVPGKAVASMIADPIFPMNGASQPAICKEQFAGKRKHNADMLSLMIQFLLHTRGKKPMYLLLMDIVKAFDKVNRDIIWAKLIRDGWNPQYVAWLRALYRCMRTRVRTSCGFSDFVQMAVGIGQGDPNSTALYAAFLSDLPTHLRQAGFGWDYYGI